MARFDLSRRCPRYGRRVTTRVAVFDLGSSSFHLFVCDVVDGNELLPVLHRRAVLQLGASLGATGAISSERATAAVASAKRLRRALDSQAADLVVALGTAALRDATNGSAVVRRLERAIGYAVRVLDGEEEARLCFVGQRASVWAGSGPVVGLDLGGGSLEVVVSDGTGTKLATSLPVGAARLRAEVGASDPLTERNRQDVEDRTTEIVREFEPSFRAFRGISARALLSGGTSRALARLAASKGRVNGADIGQSVNQVELPRDQLQDLALRLAPMSLTQRLSMPGMNRRRAEVVPAGATILAATATVLGIERYVVSEWGLREGAVIDALRRG